RSQLAELGGIMRRRILDRLMAAGVTVIDPATTYVDDTVTIGTDTVLHPNVSLAGRTVVGAECVVSAGCQVTDTTIADGVLLKPYCVLAESTVETGAQLGPFCHLRPLSHVGANAKIGNFVELKKSRIGRGSKVPHLSYVGDTQMGEGVNVGAGTITCNYDGVKKHETVIGDGVFVGTNSSLVAPLTIGEGAYVAAGSVITKSVPPGALAVARGRQETREGWVSRKQKDKKPKHGEEAMCGIVGYVGDKSAIDIVLEGLKRLEYRGYDSAGAAVIGPEGLQIRRAAGRIKVLEGILRERPIDGPIGLGHTRWATHGRPTDEKPHPHPDGSGGLVVVHNGIIENSLPIKERLQAEGHVFKSETDTEVIAHLVERHLKDTPRLDEAVRRALRELRGSYAVVVLHRRMPDRLVAAKLGAGSVVVGLGENETFLASDIPAILSH